MLPSRSCARRGSPAAGMPGGRRKPPCPPAAARGWFPPSVGACRHRLAAAPARRQNPAVNPRESAMSHVRKTALPLLVVAMGAALSACSRNEEAAGAAPAPVSSPEATQAGVPASVHVHTFQVGSLQGSALRDVGSAVHNDNSVLDVGLTPDEVDGVLSGAGLDTDRLRMSVQQLMVRDGQRVMLFDAGAGKLVGDSAGKLGAALQAAG